MFGISYETWSSVCRMYASLKPGSKSAYLQWFPFSKLSADDIEELCSQSFFDKYIKSSAFVFYSSAMHQSENYLQKSDGSFRVSALVSPILYLVLQAVGKEISQKYISNRPSNVEVYYAGNYDRMRAKYKADYDDFFKSLNAQIDEYQYFIKTDLRNFFANISVDKLVHQIDMVCNLDDSCFTQTQLQLYKELLLYAGEGRFPLIENSMASSYLATVIYLDIIDQRLHDFISKKLPLIKSFKMVRYVDDMYILINSDMSFSYIQGAYNEIRNEYSSILKEYGLALNTGKCCVKPAKDINAELKKSLYDEYFNGEKKAIEELFRGSLKNFLFDLSLELLMDSVDIEKYNLLIEKHFSLADVEFTPNEVFNYFIYENQSELQTPEVIEEIVGLVKQEIAFVSLDPKRLCAMIMGTRSDEAIKNVLNHLFCRGRAGKWNSYDTTIAITYLIQSRFRHIDLIKILKNESSNLYQYYLLNCAGSFMRYFKSSQWDTCISIAQADWKVSYLYFMHRVEMARHNNMSSFAFFKNFFDRITAHFAFITKLDPKEKKPNFKKYYTESTIKAVYQDIEGSEAIIKAAHELRNANPVAHSSAGLIDKKDTASELSDSIDAMKQLIKDFITLKKL